MREPGEIAASMPRPGRALKVVLALVAAFALLGAVVFHWAPGGQRGAELLKWLAFEPRELASRPWTLLTSGLVTDPTSISHALWSLVGLYFLSTDLEKRWGSARFVRFLALSTILGNLAVFAVSMLHLGNAIFHPSIVYGPLAAISATAIAWSRDNATRRFLLFFFIPMTGRYLLWVTIGFALLALVFAQGVPEGAVAPLGGVVAGLLFGGTPSPARAAWLRFKLLLLRRRAGAVTVESILDAPSRPRTPKRGGRGGPPLRVVPGGLEDELKKRKPPKDKRYLN